MEDWWLRQFERLVRLEREGRSSAELGGRWQVLNAMVWHPQKSRIMLKLPPQINRFMDDWDVRTKDSVYAQKQLKEAEDWLGTKIFR